MSLTVPTFVDSALTFPNPSGYAPEGLPDFPALGINRLDRAYQFNLDTPDDQIRQNLGPALGSVRGHLVINGEFFNADEPASLDVRKVARFTEQLDLFRFLTPPGTKIWWFGGPIIGTSYTDAADLARIRDANRAFRELGVPKHFDGIAWGVYYSPGNLSSLVQAVETALGFYSDWNVPTMLYCWHRYFPTPSFPANDYLASWEWEYILMWARVAYEQKKVAGVAWYTFPADLSAPKWNPPVDQPYLDALCRILA